MTAAPAHKNKEEEEEKEKEADPRSEEHAKRVAADAARQGGRAVGVSSIRKLLQ